MKIRLVSGSQKKKEMLNPSLIFISMQGAFPARSASACAA
jgi:hypothetical protein